MSQPQYASFLGALFILFLGLLLLVCGCGVNASRETERSPGEF